MIWVFSWGLVVFSICIVSSLVLLVFLMDIVVIGILVGICMIDSRELRLFSLFSGIGILIIGSGVVVVIILGKCVVLFVLVMIILRLCLVVLCV